MQPVLQYILSDKCFEETHENTHLNAAESLQAGQSISSNPVTAVNLVTP